MFVKLFHKQGKIKNWISKKNLDISKAVEFRYREAGYIFPEIFKKIY